MLDIKFIREHKDLIKDAARKKHIEFDVEKLLEVDDKRREILLSVETKRNTQNEASEKIAIVATPEERNALIADMKVIKDQLQVEEENLKMIMSEWQTLMLAVPNIPDVSVPEGDDESENVEVHKWGEIIDRDYEVKDHITLMEDLDMVDFARGTKVHGFRGYFLKNAGAELSWALWDLAREHFGSRNFTPFIAPAMVRKEYFYATGHLPKEAEDLYKTQDDDYLSGTAEVPMMAFHGDEILKKEELPKRYLAFSPCFRREAGSHGKDTKGIIRVQEFYKLEQLILCEADHKQSEELHEEINRNFEEFMELLGLPYHRLLICGGDLSTSKVKQYDTEVWFPSQKAYRELSSASYYHDFQTRRFNIRYDDEGKKKYTHSLNCTAVATPRILAAVVENYQQPDGSIKIPDALKKYMNGKEAITK